MKNERGNSPGSVDEKYKLYLHDLGQIVKERAYQARKERNDAPRESVEYAFRAGRLLGFNEVVSILQQQALAFNIRLDELELDSVDPDRDLV